MQSEEGDDVFSMTDFNFMHVGIELIGDKIKDTHTSELQQEDWMQMLPDTQGPYLTPPSLPQTVATTKFRRGVGSEGAIFKGATKTNGYR